MTGGSTASTETVSLDDVDADPHGEVFADRPRTVKLALDAGDSMPEHRHPGLDVLFQVLDGEMRLSLDDETHDLTAGDVIRFSGDREISPEAVSDATALVVFAPRSE